jgi:hypothetical protein
VSLLDTCAHGHIAHGTAQLQRNGAVSWSTPAPSLDEAEAGAQAYDHLEQLHELFHLVGAGANAALDPESDGEEPDRRSDEPDEWHGRDHRSDGQRRGEGRDRRGHDPQDQVFLRIDGEAGAFKLQRPVLGHLRVDEVDAAEVHRLAAPQARPERERRPFASVAGERASCSLGLQSRTPKPKYQRASGR